MDNSPKRFRLVPILLLSFLVIVAGSVFYYFKNNEMKNNAFKTSFVNAQAVHVIGDVDASIAEFEKLLNSAPDKVSEAKMRQYLVDNLFDRDEGSDRLKAIQLTEETINDYRIPPRSRAMALNILASNIMGESDSFFRLYFSDETLKKYFPEDDMRTDSYNIAIKMFKDAENIYPTPYAEYQITDAYYQLIVAGKLADGLTSKEDMARAMQEYIKKGDETIATDRNYIPGTLARLYYTRVVNGSYAGRILDNMSMEERETMFKDAIARISALSTTRDPRVISYLLRTQFHYAGVLVDYTVGREVDIQEILKPFSAVNPDSTGYEGVNDYFKKVEKRSDENIQKKRIAKLVKISPEFKSYLLKLGLEP